MISQPNLVIGDDYNKNTATLNKQTTITPLRIPQISRPPPPKCHIHNIKWVQFHSNTEVFICVWPSSICCTTSPAPPIFDAPDLIHIASDTFQFWGRKGSDRRQTVLDQWPQVSACCPLDGRELEENITNITALLSAVQRLVTKHALRIYSVFLKKDKGHT